MVMLLKKHQLHCLVLGIKEKSETKPQGNFMSQCMNPVSENILVICTIEIPDQVKIEDSLVRTWNSTLPYL